MRGDFTKRLPLAVVALAVAAGLVLIGRLTAGATSRNDDSAVPGHRDADLAAYLDGLQAGVAQGRAEGRALQAGDAVSPDSRQPVEDAFRKGYAAGADDVFAGYDGGWQLGQRYVITLAKGPPPVTYRIDSRTALLDGSDQG